LPRDHDFTNKLPEWAVAPTLQQQACAKMFLGLNAIFLTVAIQD
jgi:hypothetical protein